MSKTVVNSKLLIVSSEGQTNHNKFSINFNNHHHLTDVRVISLVSASFMNSQYNINGSNNTLSYNGTQVSVPIGQYSIDTLVTAFNAALGAIVSIAVSTDRKEVVVFTAGAAQVTISSTGLAGVLGLTSDVVIPAGTSLTGHTLPDMIGLTQIWLSCPQIAKSNAIGSSGISHNVFSVIPVTENFGQLVNYQPGDVGDSVIFQKGHDITAMDIELLDTNLQPLHLTRPVHFVFKVSY